jgi:hypothetical protein
MGGNVLVELFWRNVVVGQVLKDLYWWNCTGGTVLGKTILMKPCWLIYVSGTVLVKLS